MPADGIADAVWSAKRLMVLLPFKCVTREQNPPSFGSPLLYPLASVLFRCAGSYKTSPPGTNGTLYFVEIGPQQLVRG